MRDFTKGSVLKHLLAFALPIILGDFLFSLYNVIDAIWVGKLLGYQALAAVSVTTPLIFFLISILIGLGVSTNTLVAQSYGAKDTTVLTKVLINSYFTIIFLCLGISLFSIVFSNYILEIVNTPPELKGGARTYFVILSAGLIFKFIYRWLTGVLRGLGDSKTPLLLLVVSVVLNIILTPVLIVGFGPVPKLGVAGSALGTVFSALIADVIGYIYLRKKNSLLNISRWRLRIDIHIIKKIFFCRRTCFPPDDYKISELGDDYFLSEQVWCRSYCCLWDWSAARYVCFSSFSFYRDRCFFNGCPESRCITR